jgi:hypothetical protein
VSLERFSRKPRVARPFIAASEVWRARTLSKPTSRSLSGGPAFDLLWGPLGCQSTSRVLAESPRPSPALGANRERIPPDLARDLDLDPFQSSFLFAASCNQAHTAPKVNVLVHIPLPRRFLRLVWASQNASRCIRRNLVIWTTRSTTTLAGAPLPSEPTASAYSYPGLQGDRNPVRLW